MLKETKQYILDMFELNELLSQDTILGDIIVEARLDVKAFGRKLKKFQSDYDAFVKALNKTKQDFTKILKEQSDSVKEIESYLKIYNDLYSDGKNNDKDKKDDDVIISKLITYENVIFDHFDKLKIIAQECEFYI